MLVAALRGRDVEVVVVDPRAEQVVGRLERLGIAATSARCFTGCLCVEEFAVWYRDERAGDVVEGLRTWASEAGLNDAVADGGGSEMAVEFQGQVHAAWGPCDRPSCRANHAVFSHSADIEIPAGGPDENGDIRLLVPQQRLYRQVDPLKVPTLLAHLKGRIGPAPSRASSPGRGVSRHRLRDQPAAALRRRWEHLRHEQALDPRTERPPQALSSRSGLDSGGST